MRIDKALLLVVCSAAHVAGVGCVGTTGGEHVSFRAAAAGPEDAANGTLEFDNGRGFHVLLTRARLHIGALYLNQSVPSSGSQATSCILPGIYVGEVLGALDVDALSPKPQAFPSRGDGTSFEAKAGELWLTGGDVDRIEDTTVILDAAGTADQNGAEYPFEARLTIGANRIIPSTNPAYPGANPICKQRIVSPIALDLTLREGGELLIRVDPRAWFAGVDFSTLQRVQDDPPLYRFVDSATTPADISLYDGLHARTGAYRFIWK